MQTKPGEQQPFSLMLQQNATSFLAPGAPFEVPVLFQVSPGSELARVADKERVVEALAVLVLRKLDGKLFTYCNDTSSAQYAIRLFESSSEFLTHNECYLFSTAYAHKN